jgi:uncharacterized protein (TIGR02453 family)
MSRTPYFTPHTFRFLRELARHNERAWFADHRARYEQHVRDPFLRLIADLQGPLAAISRHYRADPRGAGGSLFRIHRDTRFRNDKTPYKTWAGARLFHERRKQVATPSFYIHVQPGHCFVGAGIWHPEPAELKRIREFLVDNPAAWTKATQAPAFRRNYPLGGEMLVRAPRGFDPAHPLVRTSSARASSSRARSPTRSPARRACCTRSSATSSRWRRSSTTCALRWTWSSRRAPTGPVPRHAKADSLPGLAMLRTYA